MERDDITKLWWYVHLLDKEKEKNVKIFLREIDQITEKNSEYKFFMLMFLKDLNPTKLSHDVKKYILQLSIRFEKELYKYCNHKNDEFSKELITEAYEYLKKYWWGKNEKK